MGTERDARAGGTNCRTGKYRFFFFFFVFVPYFGLVFVFVFILTPEQGGQIAGKYESHYWEAWKKCKIKIANI